MLIRVRVLRRGGANVSCSQSSKRNTTTHSDTFVLFCSLQGTPDAAAASPSNYTKVAGSNIAHGRDPNFGGWTDTAQLNYYSPALRSFLQDTLLKMATMVRAPRLSSC